MSLLEKQASTVMVVEDYDDTRELLCLMLQAHGCRVLEATNGREAVEIAPREHPDLILMDLSLPIMDGVTAARQIHALASTSHIPIVAVSAYCGQDDWTQKAKEAGCLDCIKKPVEFEDVDRLVHRFSVC